MKEILQPNSHLSSFSILYHGDHQLNIPTWTSYCPTWTSSETWFTMKKFNNKLNRPFTSSCWWLVSNLHIDSLFLAYALGITSSATFSTLNSGLLYTVFLDILFSFYFHYQVMICYPILELLVLQIWQRNFCRDTHPLPLNCLHQNSGHSSAHHTDSRLFCENKLWMKWFHSLW